MAHKRKKRKFRNGWGTVVLVISSVIRTIAELFDWEI